jgi:hypothetical protein
MAARNTLSIIASAMRQSGLRTTVQALARYPSWRQIMKPYAPGILGLAIAVGLWGFGYKLSLYHHHEAPSSQIPVAKLWIDSRSASALMSSGHKAQSHLISVSQALSGPIQRFPHLTRAAVGMLPACSPIMAYFDSRIPFRSPPPPHFFFAYLASRFRL